MTEQSGVEEPAGTEEAQTVDAGQPLRARPGGEAEGGLPNLDLREGRIPVERKPMGPPLGEPDRPQDDQAESADRAEETAVDPVDPA